MDHNEIIIIIRICALVVSILTLAILGIQLFLLYNENKKDHLRRKRQSTLEYYQNFSASNFELGHKIFPSFPDFQMDDPIAFENIDESTSTSIRTFLANVEHFCVGVNSEIFDIDTVNDMAGNYLIKMYEKFEPYIKHKRIELYEPIKYYAFEKMIDDLKLIKIKEQENTQIQKNTHKAKLHPPKQA